MPRKKIITDKENRYWPYRPGFNWLLGYYEGKPVASPGGIKEYDIHKNELNPKKANQD